MNNPTFSFVANIPLEPDDEVTGMCQYQGDIMITTKMGQLWIMTDSQPPARQSFGPK